MNDLLSLVRPQEWRGHDAELATAPLVQTQSNRNEGLEVFLSMVSKSSW